MTKDELELRKEKIAEFFRRTLDFFKNNKHLIQYVFLAFILWLAVFIRKQNWNLLKDATTGKYISLEIDSALFMRYAQYIAEHGRLFAVDVMRNYPFGVDVDFGVFTSYFVAYLYKVLHLFSSSVTVEFADVIYPTVATVLSALFLFLFVRRLFDYRVALLSSLFLVVSRAFLFRSISSDHDILGLLFVFMTLYFFIVGWQAKKVRYNVLFGVLAAVTTAFSFHTAGNIRLFSVMIASFILIHVFLDSVKKSDLYVYPTWFLVSAIILLSTTSMGISGVFFDATNTLPSTIAFLSLLVYFFLDTKYVKDLDIYNKVLKKIPKGVVVFLIVGVFGFLVVSSLYGFNYFSNLVNYIQNVISRGLGYNRWASTVSENRRVFVVDWFSSFGKTLIWLFVMGLIVVLYKLFKNFKEHKSLFYIYSVCILSFLFSGYSQSSVLNRDSTLSKFMFYGSILVVILYTLYYYTYNYYKKRLTDKKFAIELDWHYSLMLIIALVNVVLGTTAIRLFFELSPFIIIVSSLALVFILDYFLSVNVKWIKYIGVIFILFLLFSPFSFAKGLIFGEAESTFNQVKSSGPSYHIQWQKAGQWVRENTAKDSVFVHWWDYGYWVQSGFERATVTDGGNRWGWWNYLTSRNLLTAPKDEDALGFLYSHNVSYFLMVGEDIGKYPAYSLIGSDHNLDRYSYMGIFGVDPSLSKEARNETILVYRGGLGLDEDFVFNGKVYPRGSVVAGIIIPVQKLVDDNGTVIGQNVLQPRIALVSGGQAVELSIKCVYIDRLYSFDNYDYGACVRIIPSASNGQINNVGGLIFMSRKVADSLVGRLYVTNQESKYFEVVYDDGNSGSPFALVNGMQIGPMRIWKVKYPEGFSLNETEYNYYTRTDYPDITLMSF